MTRVSVKKRWVVHRRRDTGSWGPRDGVGVAGGEDATGGVANPSEEGDTGAGGGSGASRARRLYAHRLGEACRWGQSRLSETNVVGMSLVDAHWLDEACRWGRSRRSGTHVVRRGWAERWPLETRAG